MTARMDVTAKWLDRYLLRMRDVTDVYPVQGTEDDPIELRIMVEFSDGQKVELIVVDAS